MNIDLIFGQTLKNCIPLFPHRTEKISIKYMVLVSERARETYRNVAHTFCCNKRNLILWLHKEQYLYNKFLLFEINVSLFLYCFSRQKAVNFLLFRINEIFVKNFPFLLCIERKNYRRKKLLKTIFSNKKNCGETILHRHLFSSSN